MVCHSWCLLLRHQCCRHSWPLPGACCDCDAEEDWYLSTIGPKADGTWGYVQYVVLERLCQLMIASSRAKDFAWSAGRAVMRYVLSAANVVTTSM